MKSLVIYYSYTGKTKAYAQNLAAERGADLYEVLQPKRHGMLKTLLSGCPKSMGLRGGIVQPITADLGSYDPIVVLAPGWAGHPAAPINNVFHLLPSGKQVEVRLLSSSGKSDAREKLSALIAQRGCTMTDYVDIKAPEA